MKYVIEFKSYADEKWRFIRDFNGPLRKGLELVYKSQRLLEQEYGKKRGVYRIRAREESKEV
jgi:hypothetical protein